MSLNNKGDKMNSPFLTQFKRKRIDDGLSNSIVLKYNTKLDYNVFQSKDTSNLMTITKTQVKTEQPDDVDNELGEEQLRKLYLQTKTLTEVKKEQSDEIDEVLLSELIATQTSTRIINEAPDEDY
jgi:hypothetical protein